LSVLAGLGGRTLVAFGCGRSASGWGLRFAPTVECHGTPLAQVAFSGGAVAFGLPLNEVDELAFGWGLRFAPTPGTRATVAESFFSRQVTH